MPGSALVPGLFALLLTISFVSRLAHADQGTAVRDLVNQFAGTVVDDGMAIGVGVGVVIGNRSYFYSYGDAVAADDGTPAIPFTPDAIFQIGSTPKSSPPICLDRTCTTMPCGSRIR